ncbi:MAG: hypothetical protein KAR79_00125 [Simkaniaceae bacterium]|nr:hypothetical protein [Simkaniaceae bacterium]
MATRKKASSTKMKKAKGGVTKTIHGGDWKLEVNPGVSVSIIEEEVSGARSRVLKVVAGTGRTV